MLSCTVSLFQCLAEKIILTVILLPLLPLLMLLQLFSGCAFVFTQCCSVFGVVNLLIETN